MCAGDGDPSAKQCLLPRIILLGGLSWLLMMGTQLDDNTAVDDIPLRGLYL